MAKRAKEELALLARNLPQAQSLDLYRLGQAIRMLYSNPKRVVAIRMHLHLGMMVWAPVRTCWFLAGLKLQ